MYHCGYEDNSKGVQRTRWYITEKIFSIRMNMKKLTNAIFKIWQSKLKTILQLTMLLFQSFGVTVQKIKS